MDDILIYFKTRNEYTSTFKSSVANLKGKSNPKGTPKPKKCEFWLEEVVSQNL